MTPGTWRYETPRERLWRKVKRLLKIVVVAKLIALLFVAGWQANRSYAEWDARGPERYVAAMPGVGAGWLDTLRRVVQVPVEVDTLLPEMVADYDNSLSGLYENWYDRVRIRTDLRVYNDVLMDVCRPSVPAYFMGIHGSGYRHPAFLWSPGVVVAHEFGHVYQNRIADSTWTRWHREIFADYFARAMLEIRGGISPDTSRQAVQLRHELQLRLWRSYWRNQ